MDWNPSKFAGIMVRTKIWPSSVTLTLCLPEQMFQMAHLHIMVNNCVKLFWNPSTIIEVMVLTFSGTHTHIDWTVIETTISRSPQASTTILRAVALIQMKYYWKQRKTPLNHLDRWTNKHTDKEMKGCTIQNHIPQPMAWKKNCYSKYQNN